MQTESLCVKPVISDPDNDINCFRFGVLIRFNNQFFYKLSMIPKNEILSCDVTTGFSLTHNTSD